MTNALPDILNTPVPPKENCVKPKNDGDSFSKSMDNLVTTPEKEEKKDEKKEIVQAVELPPVMAPLITLPQVPFEPSLNISAVPKEDAPVETVVGTGSEAAVVPSAVPAMDVSVPEVMPLPLLQNAGANQVSAEMPVMAKVDKPKGDEPKMGTSQAADALPVPLVPVADHPKEPPVEKNVALPGPELATSSVKPKSSPLVASLLANLPKKEDEPRTLPGLSLPLEHQASAKAPVLVTTSSDAAAVPPQQTEKAVVDQIIQQFSIVKEDGVNHVNFQLEPKELGKMKMTLIMNEGKDSVVVKFQVESTRVQEIVESHLPDLRDSLRHQGFSVERFDVSLGGHGAAAGQQGHAQDLPDSRRQREFSAKKFISPKEIQEFVERTEHRLNVFA